MPESLASRPLSALLAEISFYIAVICMSSLLGKEVHWSGTITNLSHRDVTPNFHLQAPGPSYREDDMYKVQSLPNQILAPVLFRVSPFKDDRIFFSHFLGECLQSLFTTATMTCGMLGCIKYVGQVFLFVSRYMFNRVHR